MFQSQAEALPTEYDIHTQTDFRPAAFATPRFSAVPSHARAVPRDVGTPIRSDVQVLALDRPANRGPARTSLASCTDVPPSPP